MKETFGYPLVYRITSYPSLVFLLALFVVILVAPETIWREEPEASTRRGTLVFLGLMILVVGAGAVRRLREPAELTLTAEGLHAPRAFGRPIFIAYESIDNIREQPRTFLKPAPELHIEGSGSSIRVNARMESYGRLRALVVARANPIAHIDLVEPPGKGR